jgi:integrase
MPRRLTDEFCRTVAPPPDKHSIIHYDAPAPKGNNYVAGFGLRVTEAGARSFVLNYRTKDGTGRRATIGSFGTWSVKAARDRAKELRREVDAGGDPVKEQRDERSAPTMSDLCEKFRLEHMPTRRFSVQRDYKSLTKVIEEEIGNRKVASISLDDMERLHRKLTFENGTPYRANRVIGAASKMFSLAITKWKMRPEPNPCKGLERNKESKRERFLSKEELERLLDALNVYDNQKFANVFRLLLLTGARAGEAISATYDQFRLEASGGTWVKPASSTKVKKDHTIPLSAPARKLLAEMRAKREQREPRVFPKIAEVTKLHPHWQKILAAAKISGLRIHDLRHSYASVLASAGTPLLTIGKLLGHEQIATTQRYAHLIDDALTKATETAGAILSGKKAAEVVLLTKRNRKA